MGTGTGSYSYISHITVSSAYVFDAYESGTSMNDSVTRRSAADTGTRPRTGSWIGVAIGLYAFGSFATGAEETPASR